MSEPASVVHHMPCAMFSFFSVCIIPWDAGACQGCFHGGYCSALFFTFGNKMMFDFALNTHCLNKWIFGKHHRIG